MENRPDVETAKAPASSVPRRRRRLPAASGASLVGVLLGLSVLILCSDAARRLVSGWALRIYNPFALTGPRVNLTYTTYVGTRLPALDINVFRGMRYAEPPVGDLRWRAPVEPRPDGLVRSAKQFGPICLGTDRPYPNGFQGEDCLFVNVWAPAGATPGSRLPVWLFIQGGGYTSNANANWDGAEVVSHSGNSIVFVNFNYRVGLWGFLASDRVRADGDLNAGMLDQRMAMRWVRAHIARFGGDPDHVIISGASAGAGSVALHLTAHGGGRPRDRGGNDHSDRERPLFVGALVMSVFLPAQPRVAELEWQFDRLALAVGCGHVNETSQMRCIRSRDVRLLQAANSASPFPGREPAPAPLFYWTPCVDGYLVPDLPYTLFERGRFVDVPMIFGTETDEGSLFAANADTKADMRAFLESNYPLLSEADLDVIMARYPLMDPLPNHRRWFPSTSLAYGEATFICPTVNILDHIVAARRRRSGQTDSRSDANATTSAGPWAYRYNVQDLDCLAEGIGVPHTFDLPAVFGPRSVVGARPSYLTYNAPVVPVVMDYMLSFVRTLSPNTLRNPLAPAWEPWGGDNATTTTKARNSNGTRPGDGDLRSRLVIETGNSRMESTPADEASRCRFWESLKDATEQSRRFGLMMERDKRLRDSKARKRKGAAGMDVAAQKRLLPLNQ